MVTISPSLYPNPVDPAPVLIVAAVIIPELFVEMSRTSPVPRPDIAVVPAGTADKFA